MSDETKATPPADDNEKLLAAMADFAIGVTHEVNNLLNSILTAAYLIEASAGDERSVREYAVRIADGVSAATAKLAPLRHFLRQEPLDEAKAEDVDLATAVSEVLDETNGLWERRTKESAVNLTRNLSPGALVRGSGSDLRVAVRNLVYNAVDAMPTGGSIVILAVARDDAALVEVRDTGVGMTPEVRARVFEPYFSTKEGRRGSGLGLSEVYGIVKRHRGMTEIDSEPGRGTVVRLLFPLARATT
jgi:signal transduction histidine kinase